MNMSAFVPPLDCRVLQVAKAGHRQEECEDAFALDAARGRFAVADGASESFAAGDWARRLVSGSVANGGRWSGWLPSARIQWAVPFDRDLSWYAETKLQEGAWATLLSLSVGQGERRPWTAIAVGDTCLFHLRADTLLRRFPIRRAADFDNQPALLGSVRASGRIRRSRIKGTWDRGDLFLLLTDALAAWFLREYENKEKPWLALQALASPTDFEAFIAGLREQKAIRNDDVTALCIRVG